MRIMLIRHGETDHNLENRMSGWTEATLSERGVEQARALGGRLRETPVSRVITSGMKRANETAELVFPSHAAQEKIDIMEDLKEMHFGAMEGLTMDEVKERYPEDFAMLIEMKGRYTFPQGESLYTFHRRIQKAGAALLKVKEEKAVAVVAHSGTIRSLLAGWIARDWRAHWRFQIDHCSLTLVTLYDGFPVLGTCNDITHLGDPLFPMNENEPSRAAD